MGVGRERCNLNKSVSLSAYKIIDKITQVKPFCVRAAVLLSLSHKIQNFQAIILNSKYIQ